MTGSTLEQDAARVCTFLRSRMRAGGRTLAAIAGPPASGKSTLAEAVVDRFNAEGWRDQARSSEAPMAALLPMDGYHLDNRLLDARGLLPRKGAPESFDARGFCSAVQRLAEAERETFHPMFDRQLDLAVANAIAISPATPLIVVEGNYLLLREDPWSALRGVFQATIFVSPPMDTLRDRLQQRWIKHGFDPEAALKRANENDLPNAIRVLDNSHAADMQLTQTEDAA